MQRIKYLISIVIFLCGANAYAQKTLATDPIAVQGGKALFDNIYSAIHQQIDTLSNINRNGVLFIKFNINDAKIQNLKFSEDHPKMLVDVLTRVLNNPKLRIKVSGNSGVNFIIPVIFDYRDGSAPKLADLLKEVPEFDANHLPERNTSGDFDSFFELKQEGSQMLAVPCVFLPWIKLNGKIK